MIGHPGTWGAKRGAGPARPVAKMTVIPYAARLGPWLGPAPLASPMQPAAQQRALLQPVAGETALPGRTGSRMVFEDV